MEFVVLFFGLGLGWGSLVGWAGTPGDWSAMAPGVLGGVATGELVIRIRDLRARRERERRLARVCERLRRGGWTDP